MRYALSFMVVVVCLLPGCDESVDPIIETERPYTLWGWLDPTRTHQRVRILEIEPLLEETRPEPLGAMVTLRNMATGETTIWQDSVVQFSSGSYGHVYTAHQVVDFNTTYRLEAMDMHGEISAVTVLTPPGTDPEITEIQSVRGNVRVRVAWRNAPGILKLGLVYNVTLSTFRNPEPEAFSVPVLSGTISGSAQAGYEILVEPSRDIAELYAALNVSPGGLSEIELLGIDVRPFVVAGDWTAPGGQFDPELLVQPGTMSNVDNGFGFVSAGFVDSFVIELPDDAAENAGFTVR